MLIFQSSDRWFDTPTRELRWSHHKFFRKPVVKTCFLWQKNSNYEKSQFWSFCMSIWFWEVCFWPIVLLFQLPSRFWGRKIKYFRKLSFFDTENMIYERIPGGNLDRSLSISGWACHIDDSERCRFLNDNLKKQGTEAICQFWTLRVVLLVRSWVFMNVLMIFIEKTKIGSKRLCLWSQNWSN